MKKYFLSIFILLAIQLGAFSQNFNRLTQIVDAPQITNGQVAYFVGTYLGTVNDNATDSEAFENMKSSGYFSKDAVADGYISLKDLCAVYAKACGVKGGMMFSLSKKSPRYAFKEFKAKGWLPGNADPSLKVSGANAIGLFNSVTGDAE